MFILFPVSSLSPENCFVENSAASLENTNCAPSPAPSLSDHRLKNHFVKGDSTSEKQKQKNSFELHNST